VATEFEGKIKSTPEMSPKEIEEMRSTMESVSRKVIAENIERMKKTWPNRPKNMQYFDEISRFLWKTLRGDSRTKRSGQENHRLFLHVCTY